MSFNSDFLLPRHVVITRNEWMEPYHRWEREEQQARIVAASSNGEALILWLRTIAIYRSALLRGFELDPELNEDERAATRLRLDIITLAGVSSKCVLDLLVAGYYTQACGVVRHLIESWFHLVFLRYSDASEAWRWLPNNVVPAVVLARPGFPRRRRVPEVSEVKALLRDRGTRRDKEASSKLVRGYGTMSSHSHPSAEGLSQLFFPEFYGPRTLGPTFSQIHFNLVCKWGMAAGLRCVEELSYFDPSRESWWTEYGELSFLFGEWLTENQTTVDDEEEDVDPTSSS